MSATTRWIRCLLLAIVAVGGLNAVVPREAAAAQYCEIACQFGDAPCSLPCFDGAVGWTTCGDDGYACV
jgi:hypothetical protein